MCAMCVGLRCTQQIRHRTKGAPLPGAGLRKAKGGRRCRASLDASYLALAPRPRLGPLLLLAEHTDPIPGSDESGIRSPTSLMRDRFWASS